MGDAEPAAEQLVTLQCGERTLETLDWESVLRVRDDSQPLDRADQAATARDGMCQLWMSLEGQPGEHGHHRNAHRLDTSI